MREEWNAEGKRIERRRPDPSAASNGLSSVEAPEAKRPPALCSPNAADAVVGEAKGNFIPPKIIISTKNEN